MNATVNVVRMVGNTSAKTPQTIYTSMDIQALYEFPVGQGFSFMLSGDYDIKAEDKLVITVNAGSPAVGTLIVKGVPQKQTMQTQESIGVAIQQ